jgi:hypothetical protein
VVTSDGNVAIGNTVTSGYKLLVSGQTAISASSSGANLVVIQNNVGNIATFTNTATATADAVRITNLGSGNSFVVEDSTNPDASPFVINADGNIGIGRQPTSRKLEMTGNFAVTGQTTLSTSSGNVAVLLVDSHASNTADCVRITNLGSGNSFVVEDAANPDSSPFVINNAGQVGIGTTSLGTNTLSLTGNAYFSNGNFISGIGAYINFTNTGFVITNGALNTTPALLVRNISASGASLVVNDDFTDTTPFIVDAGGNVGVKTESPSTDFEVNGNAKVTSLTIGSSAALTGVATNAEAVAGASATLAVTPSAMREMMNSFVVHDTTASGAANGGGTNTNIWDTMSFLTSATLANSNARRYSATASASFFPWAYPSQPSYKLDFSKVVAVRWTIGTVGGSGRVFIENDGWFGCFIAQNQSTTAITGGIVQNIGFGWKLDAAGNITVSARNASGTTTATFASGFDIVNLRTTTNSSPAYEVYQYSDGTGNLYTYVDGVLKSTITAAPSTMSDIASSPFALWGIHINNGTSVPTNQTAFTSSFPRLYIGK